MNHKITITSNGKHRGTKLYIDDKLVKFDSLTISGDKNIDYDIVIGLSQSKAVKSEIQKETGIVTDVIGFQVLDTDEDDEEEEY